MLKNDLVRLHHILDAAQEAVAFVGNCSREDLDSDRMLSSEVFVSVWCRLGRVRKWL